ncbi:MAG: tRNA (N6-isopentenyl adenosine(37)-C2)-methylthiotransferase MiaB [Candidatus Theseobacter exili]|nr:tRNA (N6-isopentenyl adenosine(37)-C2)-methylthiotransferase MiaB [Candidatus Theseobacter exili]
MNVYDSSVVSDILEQCSYELVDTVDNADIVILNTCSVRKHAEDRVFGALRNLFLRKKKQSRLIIGLMGCMVNAYEDELLERFPELDFVAGTKNFHEIPSLIKKIFGHRSQELLVTDSKIPSSYYEAHTTVNGIKAYVPIMRGCDNFCSYCIVPYVRGREESRVSDEIISEVQTLADRGCREITLLGQNVNSYGKGLCDESITFACLLEKVASVDEIEIVRFMTSHPKDVSIDLFRVMQNNPKIEKHIHLPFQSASDSILKRMNRGYTFGEYRKSIELLRNLLPDVSLSTDIIVGFCGETAEEYEQTKRAMIEMEFDDAYIFKYSPRKSTKAYDLADTVPLKEKLRRNNELLEIKRDIATKKNTVLLGSEQKVLVEGSSRKGYPEVKGRTWTDKEVVFKTDKSFLGKIVKVKIEKLVHETFIGKLV